MTISQLEEHARLRRWKTREAIALAMESRWEEATRVNQEILSLFPKDVDTYNRLGKALSEIGRYREAQAAFKQALEISPSNIIARRNLERLAHLRAVGARPRRSHKVTPCLFIEESGKTRITHLHSLAPRPVLARMAAGDPVHLVVRDGALLVENSHAEYLGQVEPRLAARLMRLMRGGNRYIALLTSLNEHAVAVLIREVYHNPTQARVTSFPTHGGQTHYYTSEALIPYELEDGEEDAERQPLDWVDEEPSLLAEDRALVEAPPEPEAGDLEIPTPGDEDEEVPL